MKPLGIRVTIAEPGPFRTDFLGRSAAIAKERIAEYDATAGVARTYFETQAGKQKGDPQRAVEAMIEVAELDDPPLRLLLGSNAITRLEAKLEKWREEIDRYRALTMSADFPEESNASAG